MKSSELTAADHAILNHGACARCTRDGFIIWHNGEPCPNDRRKREQAAS